MNQWEQAEQDLAFLINGDVTTDLALQYKDIDVTTENFTYSVKWQSQVSKYNSILFETLLINTSNNQSMAGSFTSCQADRYAIKWYDNNNKTVWGIFDTLLLKEEINKGDWKVQYTNTRTNNANRRERRTYNSTTMVQVPPSSIINSPAYLTGINTTQYKV